MATRQRPADQGDLDAQTIVADICREIRGGRVGHALSQRTVAAAVGISHSWLSLIERGLVPDLTFRQAARLLRVTGQVLSARSYPTGSPLRDTPQLELLSRLRPLLHRTLRWATEVPLPIAGDQRAWDAFIRGAGWTIGVEVETRPRDLQALIRRVLLKARDGDVTAVLLVLLDSRYNRRLVREHGDVLRGSFPVSGTRALELLGAAAGPEGNAIVLL